MQWVEVTVEQVHDNLPTDVKARHAAWLADNPEKEGRLATITENTIKEFRYAIQSAYANLLDPRETYLPQSAVRHCESIIVFVLCMEMGLELSTAANSARNAADIYLRGIPFHRFKFTSELAVGPQPRWTVPARIPGGSRTLPDLLALAALLGALL